MRYEASVSSDLRLTHITLSESSHTDALPLVSEVFISDAEFDTESAAFTLACLILTRRFIGEDAAFATAPVGIETARAARRICPSLESIGPVNGLDRSHCTGEIDVICRLAGGPRMLSLGHVDQVPIVEIDWSGDFVKRETRNSAGFTLGRYFTNAALVADDTTVSVALGLMHAGKLCRNLYVHQPAEPIVKSFEPVVAGLALVGVSLQFLPALPK